MVAERGERSGSWGTGLLISVDSVDDATIDSNIGDAWANMSAGATGMLFAETIAAGATQNVAPYYALTWCNDMNLMMQASATNMADPKVQANMAAANATVMGRIIAKTIL